MLVHLWRRRPVKLPPGFSFWVLFLVWLVAGLLVLDLNPPGTVPDTASGRLLGWGLRLVSYLAITVLLVYVGNLTEAELSRRWIVGLLAWMFAITVAGGLLGVLSPYFQFTSPFELLLPGGVRSNTYVQALVHPASSQLQDVLGYVSPRPKAPYEYTNSWGNNLSILGVWFVVLLVARRSLLRWLVLAVGLALAAVPAIYSLNRGMWIGVGLSVLYLAVRMALRGHLAILTAVVVGVMLVGGVVAVSPLKDVISGRLDNPESNSIRGSLNSKSVEMANRSPILGFGNTRNAEGSPQTITVGPSDDCPRCGSRAIGSTGQLWQLLVSDGWVGTFLYFAMFLVGLWRYRHDFSPVGVGASLVLFLALFYSLFYNAVPSPLAFYFLSLVLVWRNDLARLGLPGSGPVDAFESVPDARRPIWHRKFSRVEQA
jgi:hypothetical protein